MKRSGLIRQGDVMLVPVSRPKAKKLKLQAREDKTLAHGEATGHAHVIIDGDVLVDETGKLYVRGRGKTMLRHQDATGAIADHKPHTVPERLYEVRIENDYTPTGLQRVQD
jgi:hypothetical protein